MQVSPDVAAHPERHSLIGPARGLVVPGGRFRETYYWDSYWIVEGLLACDMFDTAHGVVSLAVRAHTTRPALRGPHY